MTATPSKKSNLGRPGVTSHAAIERVAFELFAQRGFEATTLDDIARELGVGKRTLFRYFASKNDIPWGQFDATLVAFRTILAEMPRELPLYEAVHRGVVAFNDFPPQASPAHRDRMRLILQTPALQAHSALRYQDWRQVIADYVAERTGTAPDGVQAQTVARVSLAIALSAYDIWLVDSSATLPEVLDDAMTTLIDYLPPSG